jgi:anti-anti-sigma regulatory factor
MTFRIQTSVDWNVVIFRLSGHLDIESVYELQRLFGVYGPDRKLTLDLKDVGLVDRDALKFLARCKANGAQLNDCPEYILEWIFRDGHNR